MCTIIVHIYYIHGKWEKNFVCLISRLKSMIVNLVAWNCCQQINEDIMTSSSSDPFAYHCHHTYVTKMLEEIEILECSIVSVQRLVRKCQQSQKSHHNTTFTCFL